MPTNLKTIDGVLLLDKPLGLSSNQALQRVKKILHAEKAGHTGSLDPLASGMLPICLGEATKFSQYLLDADKTYEVIAKLGEKTTTGDSEGEIISHQKVPGINEEIINNLFAKFSGEISQTPPMYSALKHQGQPLYKLARRGITVERKARVVNILHYKLLAYTADTIHFEVRCSKGTYIRTLVEDMGDYLDCGAHVNKLWRLSVGPFQVQDMIELDQLEQGSTDLKKILLPVDSLITQLPKLQLPDTDIQKLQYGQIVLLDNHSSPGLIRIYRNNNKFIGLGEIIENKIVARRLIRTLNVL